MQHLEPEYINIFHFHSKLKKKKMPSNIKQCDEVYNNNLNQDNYAVPVLVVWVSFKLIFLLKHFNTQ